MRLLVFQHIGCEHPGRLRQYLAEDGVESTTVEFDAGDPIPDLEPYDALWVLGAPMNVWDHDEHPWLAEEKQAIRCWVQELNRPYLGLCFGHQLLADALGGTCGPQTPPEVGVLPVDLTEEGRRDRLFAGLATTQTALLWHTVSVAQPPAGAVVLAESPACGVQAMRVGKHAWSMQYHIEVESDTVGNWAEIDVQRRTLEDAFGVDAIGRMTADADAHMDTFASSCRLIYDNFTQAVEEYLGSTLSSAAPAANDLGQPIGSMLDPTPEPLLPPSTPMQGRHCRLEAVDPARHGIELHAAYLEAEDGRDWTYLPYGPFDDEDGFNAWLQGQAGGADPLFFTIIDERTGLCSGLASFLRIDQRAASIEVGHIHFAPRLQQTPAATEAMYLLMARAFESGYRRYEWKCDSLNAPSKVAAERLGFVYEGRFRQATHYKGRNRDTDWYAILDADWPALDDEFRRWLDAGNFDASGHQQSSLGCRNLSA